MTSITLFARRKYQNLIFQLYIYLHFSRIGYDHGSVVRWSLLCRHWHRSGTEISQRRWQSCFFESTELHSCYQCKICSASTWRDWQKGMLCIWMKTGFWIILNLFGSFFRESLHNAYRTDIEKYFNSSHSNVLPIKFHTKYSFWQYLYTLLGWFFLPPILKSYAGTPCIFLDQAINIVFIYIYTNYFHITGRSKTLCLRWSIMWRVSGGKMWWEICTILLCKRHMLTGM